MCNPMAVQIGMAVAGGIANIAGQRKQAEATVAQANMQQTQINAQAAERSNERIKEARELRASLRAQAAESGISGNTVTLQANDTMMQAGQDLALIEKNRKNATQAVRDEAKAHIRASRYELLGGLMGQGQQTAGNIGMMQQAKGGK